MIPAPPTVAAGHLLTGAISCEHVRVQTAQQNDGGAWALGLAGTQTGRIRRVKRTHAELASLHVFDAATTYGDRTTRLRHALRPYAPGIAQERNPPLSLPISRWPRTSSRRTPTSCSGRTAFRDVWTFDD